ncbi:MAG: tetratricopeptide repeat protein [Verrucomicrobiota bacterium]
MKERLSHKLARGVVLAVLLWIGANWLWERAPGCGWGKGEVLLAVGTLVFGALYLVANPLAIWFLELFGVKEISSGTHLSCRSAEWMVQKRRYKEAIKEYERILKNDPENIKAYEGLLRILRELAPDPVYAEQVRLRALEYIKKPSDREKLRPVHEKFYV